MLRAVFRLIFHPGTIASALFFVFTAIGWHISPNGIWGLYTLTDGALAAWNSTSMLQWSAPFDPAPYNFLQGLGSQYIPNTPWLNPGALAMSLPVEPQWQYYFSYSIYFLEVFGSTIVLGRTAGLSIVRSIVAAQLLCLVIFPPYTSFFFTLPWISLAPFNAHLIAICNLLLAAFAALGTGGIRRDLLVAASIFVLLACAFYSAPVTVVTFVPCYALFALAVGVHQPSKRSIALKIGLIAVVAVGALLLRIPEYYVGTTQVTSSHLLTPALTLRGFVPSFEALGDAWKSLDWCAYPQISLCSTYPIVVLHWAGLVGAVIAVCCYRGLLRLLGVAMFIYIVLVHLYTVAAHAQVLGIFNRINKDYLVFAAYPFYALFSVVTVFSVVDLFGRVAEKSGLRARALEKINLSRPKTDGPQTRTYAESLGAAGAAVTRRLPSLAAALIVPATAVWIMWDLPNYEIRSIVQRRALPDQKLHLPVRNEIVNILIRDIGLHPGAPYRGIAAAYFAGPGSPLREKLGASPNAPFSTGLYIDSRHYFNALYGNTFMMTHLWRFNIPTFEEYGQWVTKPLYVFAREMFSRPVDTMASWEPNIFHLNIPMFQSIGIRFIITDARLSDNRLTLRATHQVGPDEPPLRPEIAGLARQGTKILGKPHLPVYLYELTDVNLASFSPTNVIPARTVKETMEILKSSDFSPARDVVLNGPQPNRVVLTPAIAPAMNVNRGRLHVRAKSNGASLLLLPVQFSNCLKVSPRVPGKGQRPQIVRANLVETALFFEGDLDATLSFEFGLGEKSSCRIRDISDYHKLDFSPWGK